MDKEKVNDISDKDTKFITQAMKNWKLELTAGGKLSLSENPERYLLGRCTFTISICNSDNTTHLENAPRATNLLKGKKRLTTKCTWMTWSCLQKINKESETNISNKNMQSEYRNRIWHWKRNHVNNEKWKKIDYGRNNTAKSRKSQNARRKGRLQVLG